MMGVTVLIFGPLTDLFGSSSLKRELVDDTDSLIKDLENEYPALSDQSYIIAVDQKVVHSNTALKAGHTVALLPPFSGG